MKIRIEIDTTEAAPDFVHSLIFDVARSDAANRDCHGHPRTGKTTGNWVYARGDSPEQFTLRYSIDITAEPPQ